MKNLNNKRIICADPLKQYYSYKNEIDNAIKNVIQSGNYILGSETRSFEKEFANYLNVKEVIGVANGTDALQIALRSLGISNGDEVITVAHTATATVAAIANCGATPSLVDIDPNSYTIDVSKVKDAITKATKAIVAVHLYGQACDMAALKEICTENSLYLVEDCAQAHGGEINGEKLGSCSDIAAFSFYPTKNLGALGDGGAIATSSEDLADLCRNLRQYGWKEKYISEIEGYNSRLDEIQAAILRVKLKGLDNDNRRRHKIAQLYNTELSTVSRIKTPIIRDTVDHVFHIYPLQVPSRDDVLKKLKAHNIFAGIHYPVPIHRQPAYKYKSKYKQLDVTDKLTEHELSLPIYPELKEDEALQITRVIQEIVTSL